MLAKRLANGDVAVALFNQGGTTTTISTTAAAIGKTGISFTLRRRLDRRHHQQHRHHQRQRARARHGGVPGQRRRHHHPARRPRHRPERLVSAASGRCLDVPNSNTANGTQPVIWDCNGGANQRWTVNGQTMQALGKCLDAPANATAGTKVQLWDCNGGTNQQWTHQLRRHHPRRPVRAVPRRRPQPHRERHRRPAVDLHRRHEPAVVPSLTEAGRSAHRPPGVDIPKETSAYLLEGGTRETRGNEPAAS